MRCSSYHHAVILLLILSWHKAVLSLPRLLFHPRRKLRGIQSSFNKKEEPSVTQEMTIQEKLDAVYRDLETITREILSRLEQQAKAIHAIDLRLQAIEECIKQMPTQKLDA